MDAVLKANAGFKAHAALETFVGNHPSLAADLVPVVLAFMEDVHAATASVSRKGEAVGGAALVPAEIIPPGFTLIPDVPCLVPRGKCEIEIGEWGLAVRGKAGPKDPSPPPPILLAVHNVIGVFHVTQKDKYKAGPAGLTHSLLFALAQPVIVGKTAHSVLGFSDTGANFAKSGSPAVRILRSIDHPKLKDASSMAGLTAGMDGSAPTLSAPDRDPLVLLKSLLSSVFGRIGEADRSIFVSANGDTSIKCINKVIEGQLFPLRRAIVWVGKPLMVLPLSHVAEIKVARGGGMARTFDLDVRMAEGKVINFSMIDNNELEPLKEYVSTRTVGGAAALPAPAAVHTARSHGQDSGSSQLVSGPGGPVSMPGMAAVSASAPPTAAYNMNEAESDEEGAGRAAGGGTGDDDDDDDEESEYEDGDSEEAYEEEEEEETAGASRHTHRAEADDEDELVAQEAGENREEEAGEDLEEDDIELDADDVDEDELAGLLEDAGDAAAPVRRRGTAGAPSSSSSSGPHVEVGEEDEDCLGPAARFALRKRRAAEAASAGGSNAHSQARPIPSRNAGDNTDDEGDGAHVAKRMRS